jgi:HK97 family phage prohead protease
MSELLRKLKRGERPEARQATFKLRQPTDAEVKALGDKPDGYIAGWASTPDLDSYRDIVMPGAFQESINKRGTKGPKGIKFLIGHDWDKPAGKIEVLEYRGDSLWIEVQLNLNISYAKDFYEASKSMDGLSFSVGFWLQEWTIKRDENDKEYFLLHKGDLFEVSGVPFPANEEAYMTFVKSANAPIMRSIFEVEAEDADPYDNEEPPASLAEFEKRLISMGLVQTRKDAKLITLEVKSAVQLFLKKDAPEVEPPEQETTEAPEAEEGIQKALELMSSIRQKFASAN